MTLEQLKTSIISFATEVGNDIKSLRASVLDVINDAQTALDATWSSTKISDELNDKVDKVTGKQLSDENYTTAEKTKLAGLEGSKFKGEFVSLTALETAYPTADVGDYANVDAGTGNDVQRYAWDSSDDSWTLQQGASTALTASEVKTLYESNPDTNGFTDNLLSKLNGIEAGAQVNTITGVKGSAEATYRTGQVSISLANLDAGTDDPLTTYTTARDS